MPIPVPFAFVQMPVPLPDVVISIPLPFVDVILIASPVVEVTDNGFAEAVEVLKVRVFPTVAIVVFCNNVPPN
jgi:hypothetical protein